MPVNIVLLVKDRKRLTEQCLDSLYKNTPQDQFTLTCVNDGSGPETNGMLRGSVQHFARPNFRLIQFHESIGIVGFLRNIGACASERYFGRGEYVMFADNDLWWGPNWLEIMDHALQVCGKDGLTSKGVKILGGCRHPYHGVNDTLAMSNGTSVQVTDAVAGYSMMMTWDTFDKYGPFPSNQKGIGASEDYGLCRRVVDDGALVGYIDFPRLAHCGLSNTDGKPATGAETFAREPGVLYE